MATAKKKAAEAEAPPEVTPEAGEAQEKAAPPAADPELTEREKKIQEWLDYIDAKEKEIEEAREELQNAYSQSWDLLPDDRKLALWRNYLTDMTVSTPTQVHYKGRAVDRDKVDHEYRGEPFTISRPSSGN